MIIAQDPILIIDEVLSINPVTERIADFINHFRIQLPADRLVYSEVNEGNGNTEVIKPLINSHIISLYREVVPEYERADLFIFPDLIVEHQFGHERFLYSDVYNKYYRLLRDYPECTLVYLLANNYFNRHMLAVSTVKWSMVEGMWNIFQMHNADCSRDIFERMYFLSLGLDGGMFELTNGTFQEYEASLPENF